MSFLTATERQGFQPGIPYLLGDCDRVVPSEREICFRIVIEWKNMVIWVHLGSICESGTAL